MANIAQDQLIGSMVPDVYIQKITLETGGFPLQESNPHIQHKRETKSVTSSAEQKMKVTVNLVMKDTFDSTLVDTWFSQQNFKKYLSITVVQSTDSLVSHILSASNNAIRLGNTKSLAQALALLTEVLDDIKDLPKLAPYNLSTADAMEVWNQLSQNMTQEKISLNDISKDESLTNYESKATDDEGGRMYNIPYSVSFTVPTSKPTHLSYFAVTSIDLEMLSNDFNLYIDDPFMADMMSGKVVLDTVIDGGGLVSTAVIFKTDEGTIWTGPVQEGENGWTTGTVGSTTSSPLTRQVIANNKIQDFRIFKRIESTQYDVTSMENKLFLDTKSFSRLSAGKLLPELKPSYFTDAGLTLDQSHNCRFVFGIDYGKLIKENVRFGNLFSSYNQGELFENVRIRSMKLMRRRLTSNHSGLNKLGSPVQMRNVFDEKTQIPKVVAKGSDSRNVNTFISHKTPGGWIEELDLSAGANSSNIRYFMGVDSGMSLVTDGFYQYGIEIEIEDNIFKPIRNKLRLLRIAKDRLDAYYKDATSKGNYNVVSNQFTEAFGKEYNTDNVLSTPYGAAVFTYGIVRSFFLKREMAASTCNDLLKMTSAITGTPRGINSLQKLMENLMTSIEQLIGDSAERPKGRRGTTTNANMPTKPPQRSFKVEYFFSKPFNSNFPKGVGYDYLSNGPSTPDTTATGLKKVSQVDYEARTNAETLKYYNSTTADVVITRDGNPLNPNDTVSNQKLTYLSPSNVKLGAQGNTCLLNQPFDITQNNNVQSTILELNATKKSPFILSLSSVKSVLWKSTVGAAKKNIASALAGANPLTPSTNSLVNTMSLVNCTIAPSTLTMTLVPPSSIDQTYDPYTDVSDLMGFEWDTIDALENQNVELMESEGDKPGSEDPTVLFSLLTKNMVSMGASMTGMFDNYNAIPDVSAEMKQKIAQSYSSDFYNTESETSAIQQAITSNNAQLSDDATLTSNDSFVGSVSQQILFLPNQIKSLFLESNASSKVVKKKWQGETGAFEQPLNLASIALNYKTIRKVQYLNGYETDAQGIALLKKPIWADLSSAAFDAMGSKSLLCRLVKYTNPAFGVHEPVGLKMPVYNKFFIITRSATTVPSSLSDPANPTSIFENKLKNELSVANIHSSDIPTEYLSTGVVKPITTKVSKQTKITLANQEKI